MHIRPANSDEIALLHGAAATPNTQSLVLVAEDDDQNPLGHLVAGYDLAQKSAVIENVQASDPAVSEALTQNAQAALNNMDCYLAGTEPDADVLKAAVAATDTAPPQDGWTEESISDNFTDNA